MIMDWTNVILTILGLLVGAIGMIPVVQKKKAELIAFRKELGELLDKSIHSTDEDSPGGKNVTVEESSEIAKEGNEAWAAFKKLISK